MHVTVLSCYIIVTLLLFQGSYQSDSDWDTLENYCIDGQNHKSLPGEEDDLHKQCTPWKKRSCCTKETTVQAHGGMMYNFNYNHCPGKPPMSPNCKKHFIQDLCFYECSPNVGPWRQSVSGMKMRKERFFEVPLCASDCETWFKDCRDDWTCTDNWTLNFNWKNQTNQCPPNSTCLTFAEVYVNASNFCERVWDHSWKYTPDSEHCMRIWFDGEGGNPNDAVTRWKIKQMQETSGADSIQLLKPIYLAMLMSLVLTWAMQ